MRREDRKLPIVEFEFSDKDKDQFRSQMNENVNAAGVSTPPHIGKPSQDLTQTNRVDIVYRMTVLKQSLSSIS